MTARIWLVLAALSGVMAVAAGAFGAHAASGEQARAWLQTGGAYQLAHALAALLALALRRDHASKAAELAAAMFVVGGLIFATSLYLMAAGGPRLLGAVTPLGGFLLICGWLSLAWALARQR